MVDLFAGCGGLALGLELQGFESIYVNEINEDALASYLANRQGMLVDHPDNYGRDIRDLTADAARLTAWGQRLRDAYGDVDVVTGGPPCQGYSGIGHRRSFQLHKKDIPSNQLYREMAKAVGAVAPKAFVFENVRGLLSARWTPEGTPGEIWADVQRAFREVRVSVGGQAMGYVMRGGVPLRASSFGVAQNRPRILLIGFRADIADAAGLTEHSSINDFMPEPTGGAPDLVDLLGDLENPRWQGGEALASYPTDPLTDAQRRMRTRRDGSLICKGETLQEQEYSNHSLHVQERFARIRLQGGRVTERDRTKKFAQRLLPSRWGPSGPTITVTSLPDDYIHYSEDRAPTVREWARMQGFPDWYEFKGPRTTGGRRRAGDPTQGLWERQVPRFTQIGNAVPVDLGQAIGRRINGALVRAERNGQGFRLSDVTYGELTG